MQEELNVGYHGTHQRSVPRIQREGILPSTGGGHWLTSNAQYLFEEPSIALGYARSRFQDEAVVLEVLYEGDACLDLTRYDVAHAVSNFGQRIVDVIPDEVMARLRQNSGTRQLDDLVLSQVVATTNYKSIRAIFSGSRQPMPPRIFPEDKPLWERDGLESGLNLHSHVQIAILQPEAIRRLRLFDHSRIELT